MDSAMYHSKHLQQWFIWAVITRTCCRQSHNIKTQGCPHEETKCWTSGTFGSLILAWLVATFKESLFLPQDIQTFYWLDFITELYWIKNARKWKQYVEDRVHEIRRLSRNNGDFVRVCKIRYIRPLVSWTERNLPKTQCGGIVPNFSADTKNHGLWIQQEETFQRKLLKKL